MPPEGPIETQARYEAGSESSRSGIKGGMASAVSPNTLKAGKGELKKVDLKSAANLELTEPNWFEKIMKGKRFFLKADDQNHSDWEIQGESKTSKVAHSEQGYTVQSEIKPLILPIAENRGQSGQSVYSSSQQPFEKTDPPGSSLSIGSLNQVLEGVLLRTVPHPSTATDNRHVSSTSGAGVVEDSSSVCMMPEEDSNEIKTDVKLNKVPTFHNALNLKKCLPKYKILERA